MHTPSRVRQCLLEQADLAIEAGIDVIQVREIDLPARDLADLVAAVVGAARRTATRVIVSERLDVALATGASGVHLRADSAPPQAVRSITPEGFLIGRSVHNVAEAVEASAHADYLIAGTVWPTASKLPGHELLGVEGLAAIVRSVSIPVLGIGGVTAARIGDLARVGAAGIAAIGLFIGEATSNSPSCRAVPLAGLVNDVRLAFDRRNSLLR